MKNLITIIFLFFAISASAQDWQLKGTKYPNATNEGDTVSLQSRLPMLDENGLLNYYLPVADLLALNPAPVLEWGNITGTLSNQTDLQGALNDKADQSDLTAHTSNGNIHFTQSAISITESQVSDLKDYLRGDINDTNGANKLTLGSLEVTGQTILQNGLNMSSVPVGTSDNILTLNTVNGDVEQRVFSLGDIDIANAAGTSQFPVGLGDQLRIQGSGDTSISFDGVTNTINITSTPGSGGGGAVTTFNGRDGAVVSEAGDYSTAMVNELTNLYFTEPRVRETPLTGLTVTNTPISSTNTFLQALGRLQGQINDRITSSYTGFDSRYVNVTGDSMNGNLIGTGANPFIINGTGVGGSNIAYIPFYESNGTTRQGYIGFPSSSSSDMTVRNGVSSKSLTLETGGQLSYNGPATFTGTITGNGLEALNAVGIASGVSNSVIIGFYESNGITRQGYIGFPSSSSSNMYLSNNISGNSLILNSSGGENGLQYYTGSSTRTVYHNGNLTLSTLGGEPAFSKNTAFNKNFGTASGTVAQGNDSRINNGQTAFSWGNHASAGYVPNTRTITAGDGLTGGGNLTGNITIDVVGAGGISTTGNAVTLTPIAAGSTSFGALQYQGTSRSAGKLYGGSTNPISTTRLNYDGHLYVSSLTSIGDVIANSDKRLKKNIKRIDNALAIVQLLGGYEYDRIDIDKHQAGVLAQEVEEVFPTAVSTADDERKTKSVAYNQLIALLIEAVKEQQIEIENLKNMINEK